MCFGASMSAICFNFFYPKKIANFFSAVLYVRERWMSNGTWPSIFGAQFLGASRDIDRPSSFPTKTFLLQPTTLSNAFLDRGMLMQYTDLWEPQSSWWSNSPCDSEFLPPPKKKKERRGGYMTLSQILDICLKCGIFVVNSIIWGVSINPLSTFLDFIGNMWILSGVHKSYEIEIWSKGIHFFISLFIHNWFIDERWNSVENMHYDIVPVISSRASLLKEPTI